MFDRDGTEPGSHTSRRTSPDANYAIIGDMSPTIALHYLRLEIHLHVVLVPSETKNKDFPSLSMNWGVVN